MNSSLFNSTLFIDHMKHADYESISTEQQEQNDVSEVVTGYTVCCLSLAVQF